MATINSKAIQPQPVRYEKMLGCRVTKSTFDRFVARAAALEMKMEEFLRQEYKRILEEEDIRLGQ